MAILMVFAPIILLMLIFVVAVIDAYMDFKDTEREKRVRRTKKERKMVLEVLNMPTAQEIRDFQSECRRKVIKAIWHNAKEGYTGVCLDNGKYDVSKQLAEELKENGFTVEYLDTYVHVKWGKSDV